MTMADKGEHRHEQGPAMDVHILPIGWEFDRAVRPLIPDGNKPPRYLAHRVHLIIPNPQGADDFDNRVREALERHMDVVVHPVRRRDQDGRLVEFEEILREASAICADELWQGNRVYFNISSGSKMAALATGLVGMAYGSGQNCSVYYVEPEGYSKTKTDHEKHGLSRGMKAIMLLQPLDVELPEPVHLHVLSYLAQREGTARYESILEHLASQARSGRLRQAQGILERIGTDEATDEARRKMWLLRNVVKPLQSEGLVEVMQVGRERHLELTPKGRTFALFAPDGPHPPESHPHIPINA